MKSIITANDTITSNSKQIDILKSHFPNCFDKHGAFIPAKLQGIIETSGITLSKESYSLNWLGKSYARLLANENVRTLLKANIEHNELPENANSSNMLIKGDNLEVLKHLLGAYSGKVKMIYIDPPYNTGSDGFVYQDDRKFTVEQLSHLAGIDNDEARRILEFTDSGSNSHSAWLTFMYPRLYLAKQLLRDDGVIFISIDDNEQAQLRLLMDEVLGEDNFAGQIIWKKKTNGNNMGHIPPVHEYIFVYVKSKSSIPESNFGFNLSNAETQAKYSNPDNDIRGLWDTMDLSANHVGPHFPIVNPSTGEQHLPAKGRYWVFNEVEVMRRLEEGRIIFGKTGKGKPVQKVFLSERQGKKKTADSWWDKYGMNEDATVELNQLFNIPKIFNHSKPTLTIKKIIDIGTERDSTEIVLDFFAGSGTTAHAVMQLNAEDGGNRQFICVQLDEATDPKSEAYKAGYKSIYDITAERIKRAAVKIKAAHPEAQCDFGFKQFETIPVFEGYLDEPEDLTPELELFNASKLSAEERHILMLTWQAQDGIALNTSLTRLDLDGYTAYQGGRLVYFIEPDLTLNAIVAFLERLDSDAAFMPNQLVVLGYLLDSKTQREMTEAVKQYNNRKGIELTLDVRF